MKIIDLKNHLDKLIEQGKGDEVIKGMYDGMIKEINTPDQILKEMEQDGKGVISGTIKKGEFLIES